MVVAVDANEKKSGSSLKFLCSYGGKILPRSTDGKLRYVGGHTRVLSVDRSISFEGSSPTSFRITSISVYNPIQSILILFFFFSQSSRRNYLNSADTPSISDVSYLTAISRL